MDFLNHLMGTDHVTGQASDTRFPPDVGKGLLVEPQDGFHLLFRIQTKQTVLFVQIMPKG